MVDDPKIQNVLFYIDDHTDPPKCVRTDPPGLERFFPVVGEVAAIPRFFAIDDGRTLQTMMRRADDNGPYYGRG